ncbi:V-set domain-containing T-cell activation inhibitor 1-like [Oreochromis niloticus]|uniref:V-set domain-containing T-cell activation inhibitor 1-like n=1 Tax=Oreochromis niloticus TaxID=8128 RepID=UPI00090519EB|nr:V-set domain-containing T-cell activation inhibitor 1-like [Oreochromis niloticus]
MNLILSLLILVFVYLFMHPCCSMDFCKQPDERSTACNSSAGCLFISIPKEDHSSITDSHLPGFQRVSQLALALVVEVNEGEGSVPLPCQYSGFIPEDNPMVLWTRDDLDPKSVHIRREGGDDLRGQNQLYSGRTSMRSDALDSSDFSLTLRKPTKTDSGNYTCSISNERQELRLRNIQLQVKDQQVEVGVEEGSESVLLPCKTKPDLPEDTKVEWTRSDQELMMVRVYSNRSDLLKKQENLYKD